LYALLASFLSRTYVGAASNILDLGTGPGYLSFELATRTDAKICGVDINETMLELSRARLSSVPESRWSLREADVHALPFADCTFDLVVSYSCFHHWENPVRALRECRRVLKVGGTLILLDTIASVASRMSELLAKSITEPHLFRFVKEALEESLSMESVREYAAAAGLSNMTVEPFSFAEEDLVNCLDSLPTDLPLVSGEQSVESLWIAYWRKELQDSTGEQIPCAD
jgi:ubiquinone/menaquinone biosynthesis C-methylase UbiE